MKLQVSEIAIGYDEKPLSSGVSFEIEEGGISFLVGANGIGKSTLLKTVSGELKPLKGNVALSGADIHQLAIKEKAALISYHRGRNEIKSRISVAEYLQIGSREMARERGKKAMANRIEELSEEMGIEHLLNTHIQSISDGEFQKVLLSLIVLRESKLILLDEPFSHLDPPSTIEVVKLFQRLSKECIVIVSSHNMELVNKYATRIFALDSGHQFIEIEVAKFSSQEAQLSVFGPRIMEG